MIKHNSHIDRDQLFDLFDKALNKCAIYDVELRGNSVLTELHEHLNNLDKSVQTI